MREVIDRRQLLSGRLKPRTRHISSALVLTFPERREEVARRISEMPDTEVHGIESGKIVIVLEGADAGEIGERMIAISLMDGVLAANLVFEQVDDPSSPGASS
jgi:nitrate reductase NapD